MNTSFSFKNFDQKEKNSLRDYWKIKELKIAKLLDRIHPDITLEIRAEKFVKKSAYCVSLILIESPKIMVSEDDHTINEALDLAEHKLIERVNKLLKKRVETTRTAMKASPRRG